MLLVSSALTGGSMDEADLENMAVEARREERGWRRVAIFATFPLSWVPSHGRSTLIPEVLLSLAAAWCSIRWA